MGFEASVGPARRVALCDAQTSGGLLIAVEAERRDALLQALARHKTAGVDIGELRRGEPGTIEVA